MSHKCIGCGKLFSTRAELETHMSNWGQPTNHRCNLCDTSFSSRDTLDNHILVVHDGQEFRLTSTQRNGNTLGEAWAEVKRQEAKSEKLLRCSHIFLISKEFTITDLGEYGHQNVHPGKVTVQDKTAIFRLVVHDALVIDSQNRYDFPNQTQRKYFISTNDTPIMDVMSCSNRHNDCMIFGEQVGETERVEDGWLYRIEPHLSAEVVSKLVLDVDKLLRVRGIPSQQPEPDAPAKEEKAKRPNPIIERMKRVKL